MNTVTTLEAVPADICMEPRRKTLPAASSQVQKPRVWTVFAVWLAATLGGMIAVVACAFTFGVVAGVVLGTQGMDPATISARVQAMFQQPLLALIVSLVPFQCGAFAVVLFAAWRSNEPLKQRLGLLPQSGCLYGGFRLASMGAFTISAALLATIGTSVFLGPPPTENAINGVLTDGSWWMVMLLGVILSTIPAVVEEVLIRGYMQRKLLRRWSPAVAIAVSTLLFAVMHFDSLQHVIAVIPLGVVTGLLAYRTNSVKPGMVVHAVHNATIVGVGAALTAATPFLSEANLGLLVIGSIAGLSLIGLPAVVSLLRGTKPAVETCVVPDRILPDYLTDSRLAGKAA